MSDLEFSFLFGFLGLLLGSFASLLIHRLHFEESGIWAGRSRCPHCKSPLQPQHLIPVLSWLWQKGKCSFCEVRISFFYPLTEIIFGMVFFFFAEKFDLSLELVPLFIAILFLLILFFYDLRFLEVDRRISWPAIGLALAWIPFREETWQVYILGGLIGFLFYASQYFISKGRWVGAGDMELGLLMGLLLGWKLVLGAFFVAYILGSLVAIPLLLMKKATGKTALPMGAFLLPATLLFLYDGARIVQWYISFIGL